MGNVSYRDTSTPPPIGPIFSRDVSVDDVSLSPIPITPTREEYIRNLIAESRGCNQLDVLIESHGEPIRIVEPDHSDIETMIEEVSTEARRCFTNYTHGHTLNTIVHEVLIWDNHIAFTVKDPDTSEVVVFRIWHRPLDI